MNCFPKIKSPFAVLFRVLLCLGLVTPALPSLAQTRTPVADQTNRLSTERFLIILDISAAMQKRAANVPRVVSQMFSASLNEQLHPGDTIGLWTYNNELHTGEFPLQRWTPRADRDIASSTVRFIQQRRYEKQSRLAPVIAQMTNVVADSDKITVILLSDGSEAPVGTPFDTQISDAFKRNGDEQRRQAMPFVTVLRAVKGKFVGFKVNTPPWPVEFPPFPIEPIPATPPPPNPPPAMVENPPPASPTTPVIAQPTPAPAEINRVVPIPTNSTVAVEPSPAPPPAKPVTNTTPTVVAAPAPSATNIAAAPAPSSPEPTVAVAKPAGNLPILPIVVGAAIALVGVAILCLALLRRSRETPRVSLITRSMNKDRK